ncbi:hypothetical protein KSP40_PGU005268 [Platanthera guangdongensis]|uniref:Uncharacterized protein n=1 Tax=Platanthera guangdongensis TaxID=2320717 RepID=A0ABR2LDX1_9ASPA
MEVEGGRSGDVEALRYQICGPSVDGEACWSFENISSKDLDRCSESLLKIRLKKMARALLHSSSLSSSSYFALAALTTCMGSTLDQSTFISTSGFPLHHQKIPHESIIGSTYHLDYQIRGCCNNSVTTFQDFALFYLHFEFLNVSTVWKWCAFSTKLYLMWVDEPSKEFWTSYHCWQFQLDLDLHDATCYRHSHESAPAAPARFLARASAAYILMCLYGCLHPPFA